MRKLLSLLVFILLGVSLFAGGGGQAKDSSGPVKLRFLYPGTSEIERQWSTELAQRVKAAYPNYEIEFIYLVWADMEPKLVSMIQAQDYPDIIAVQETTNYVTMDALEPLDAYFDTGANPVKKSNLIQSALDHFSMSSKVYALPDRVVNYGMVVNEKLLSTVGVKPEDLKTWDDVKKNRRPFD